MLELYDENNVIVLGYSLGTGIAAYLASNNNPQRLILVAPYYSMQHIVKEHCPVLPSFVIRYK